MSELDGGSGALKFMMMARGGAASPPPVFTSAEVGTVNLNTVAVTFDRNVSASNFATGVTIKVNGSSVIVGSGTRQSNHAIVYYLINQGVIYTDTVTWEYTGGNTVAETGGTSLATVAAQSVTNNTIVPTAVTGLHTWADFSDITTLFTDTARTTPVASDGDNIKGVADKSGLGHHLSEATNPPVYKTSIQNSKSISRYLDTSAQKLTGASATYNCWLVAYKLTAAAISFPTVLGSSSGTVPYVLVDNNVGNIYNGGGTILNGGGFARIDRRDYPNVRPMRTDFVQVTTWGTNTTGTLLLAAGAGAGKDDVGEVLAFTSDPGSTTRDKLEKYLRAKWFPVPVGGYVFEGDSLTSGVGATPGVSDYPTQLMNLLSVPYNKTNVGAASDFISGMIAEGYLEVDPLYNPGVPRNYAFIWAGTNDVARGDSATTVYNNIVTWCNRRKDLGWTVIVLTMLPRVAFDAGMITNRHTINTNIVSNWATFADCLVDLAADGRIGDDGDYADTTYYNVDQTHLNPTGYGVVASLAQAAQAAAGL